MSADELAAKNSERLDACPRHDFEPVPDWRKVAIFSRMLCRCRCCGGEMGGHDVMLYLRGLAHGSGQSVDALAAAVFLS